MKRNKELFIEIIGQIAQEDWRRRQVKTSRLIQNLF